MDNRYINIFGTRASDLELYTLFSDVKSIKSSSCDFSLPPDIFLLRNCLVMHYKLESKEKHYHVNLLKEIYHSVFIQFPHVPVSYQALL